MKMTSIKFNGQRMQKTLQIAILLLTFLVLINTVQGIQINSVNNFNVSINDTVAFQIIATNYSGDVVFTKSLNKGTLTRINNSHANYTWITSSGDEGTYSLMINATDNNNTATQNTSIIVNGEGQVPQIIEKSSFETQSSKKIEFSVVTDISSTCKYALSDGIYSDLQYTMSTQNTQKTEHSGTIPELSQGINTIYVRCADNYETTMKTSETISVNVNLKPTAAISLDPAPPLTEDTIHVRLTVSEELIEAPKLYYNFDDDQTNLPITMIGSGSSWEGYMIIRSKDTNRVGTFTFSGKDLTNTEGTEITSGKIFIVDTLTPDTVRSIEAINEDDRIKIVWDYDRENRDNIDEYKIYRRSGSGMVDYVDYHDSTSRDYYYDDDVEYNQAYYYRVSILDEAGNEGPLSKEVFVTHTPIIEKEENEKTIVGESNTVSKLSSKLQYKLSLENQKLEKILMDIDAIDRRIGQIKGTDNIEVVQALGITSLVKTQQNLVKGYQEELKALENEDLTESDFDKKVAEIITKANNARTATPQDVKLIDVSKYQEFVDESKVEEAYRSLLNSKDITVEASQIRSLLSKNKKIQDQITIESTVIKAQVEYQDKTDPIITIRKVITADIPIDNVQIIEIIPKDLAESVKEIIFSEQPTIIEEDPVVSWTVDKLSKKTIVYSVVKDLNLAEAKSVKTITISSETEEYIPNGLTGRAIDNIESGEGDIYTIPLIAAILVAVALAGYYFFSYEDKEPNKEGSISKRLLVLQSRFRKKHKSIMPDEKQDYDNHKKLSFRELSNGQNDYIHQSNSQNTVSLFKNSEQESSKQESSKQPTGNGEQPTANRTQIADWQNTETQNTEAHSINTKISHIEELSNKLSKYTNDNKSYDDMNVEHLDSLQKYTADMKSKLDEIEKRNLEAYTQKAKKTLGEALKYIHRINYEKENKASHSNKEISYLDKLIPDEKAFILSNGVKLRSLRDLQEYTHFMTTDIFNFHVNEFKNDFVNWINNVIENIELAKELESVKDLYEFKKIIKNL